jgi:hypothetical protein
MFKETVFTNSIPVSKCTGILITNKALFRRLEVSVTRNSLRALKKPDYTMKVA